jgi:ligand-binding sensor domain-containing protein
MTHYSVEYDKAMLNGISIYLDRQNNPWLGSQKDGVYKFNGKAFEKFRPGQQNAAIAKGEVVSEPPRSCWYVFQDSKNNYWFGSDGHGVFRFDGKPGGTITQFTTKDGLSNDQIRGIQEHAPTGDILITTSGEVSKFDGQRFTTLHATVMESPEPLPENGWLLNPDDVWLPWQPMQNGPYRYDGKTLFHLKFPKSPQEDASLASGGKPNPAWSPYEVYCVYKDRKGHMWFGTANMGICRFDGKTVQWMYEDHLTNTPEGGMFGIRSIIEDQRGAFWFCNTQYRYKIEPALQGAIGQKAGKLKYTREKGMDLAGSATTDKFLYFQSIAEDNDGHLWMAPYAGGVWKYDGTNVTHFPMKESDPPNNEITMFTIYKDNHGGLWVGTHEHGPYKFNGTAFERFKS